MASQRTPTTSLKTSKPDFLLLIFQQISSLKSNEIFLKKITSFFDILPHEPSYLIEIEKQAKEVKNEQRLQKIELKLRKAWYEVWRQNQYDKKQEIYFKKHYPLLTQFERFHLEKMFKVNQLDTLFSPPNSQIQNSSKSSIILKPIDELAMALKNYKLGNKNYLNQFVKKQVKLTPLQSTKIIEVLYEKEKYSSHTMVPKLLTEILNKTEKFPGGKTYSLLSALIFLKPLDFQLLAPALENSLSRSGVSDNLRIESYFYSKKHEENQPPPLFIIMKAFTGCANLDYDVDNPKLEYHSKSFLDFCQNLNWAYQNGLLPKTQLFLEKDKNYQKMKHKYEGNVSGAIIDLFGSKKNMENVSLQFETFYSFAQEFSFEENPEFHSQLHTIYQKDLLNKKISLTDKSKNKKILKI